MLGIRTGETSTFTGGQGISDWERYETFRRKDDVLPMTSTGEGTSYVAADGRLDDESDVDPPRELGPDGAEVALFSEPEPVPTEAEGGSDDEEEDLRFRAFLINVLIKHLSGVVVPRPGILAPPVWDLVVGVERMNHLDKIMNPEVFASSMAKVVESHKAMGIGKKKSSPTATRAIPHATAAYRSTDEQE
ncbi:hypothetical protein J1N35_001490 [Gossypium stocksii]|uniref:Uncharacterized protein n=1 Tax=Gossypium stocksii TaxID=47602 RepID=A0A9D4AL44_9ROSI|nr:hypothetical protein J1N35_001490 [Gossypium stocksii]